MRGSGPAVHGGDTAWKGRKMCTKGISSRGKLIFHSIGRWRASSRRDWVILEFGEARFPEEGR